VAVVWLGLVNLVRYQVEMYYSNVVPTQMSDDSAYSILQTQDTVGTIITLLAWLGFILLGYLVYRVWYPKIKKTV
jgi:hypothetical protein